MSTKKKDLKDLVAGDKVVLVKAPSASYYGYGCAVGTVFTVVKGCNPVHNGVLVKDVPFKGETADRYINSNFIEHYVEEEKKMFTKNDLKTGMWVKFRGGDVGIVLEVAGTLFVMDVTNSTCIARIDSTFTYDMRSSSSSAYDIVKVFAPSSNCNYLLRQDKVGVCLFDRKGLEEKQEAYKKIVAEIHALQAKADTLWNEIV